MPAAMIRLMTVVPGSSLIFLLITAAIFIFFGAVIEGLPAVVILLPSLLPVAAGLGIDPIHYAIVIVAAVGIGLFLPPIGVGLFIACGIAEVSVDRATRAMLPFVAVLLIGLAHHHPGAADHADPAPPLPAPLRLGDHATPRYRRLTSSSASSPAGVPS